MKEFDHPNIVGVLGVCFDTPDGYPYLILPFMANGNIKDYLKDKRVQPTNTATLPEVCCYDYYSMRLVYEHLMSILGLLHKDPCDYVC